MRRWEMLLAAAVTLAVGVGVASAKLPPPTDEQKAKAAEAKAKGDAAAKVQGELLGKAQDRAADNYKRMHGGKPAMATPAAMPATGAAKK